MLLLRARHCRRQLLFAPLTSIDYNIGVIRFSRDIIVISLDTMTRTPAKRPGIFYRRRASRLRLTLQVLRPFFFFAISAAEARIFLLLMAEKPFFDGTAFASSRLTNMYRQDKFDLPTPAHVPAF